MNDTIARTSQHKGRDTRREPADSIAEVEGIATTDKERETGSKMGRDGGFHPFKGRVSRHFGDSVRAYFLLSLFLACHSGIASGLVRSKREGGRAWWGSEACFRGGY